MQVTTPSGTVADPSASRRPLPFIPDTGAEEQNARRILAVCRHFSTRPLETLTVLELRAGAGLMSECFAATFKSVIAVDTDRPGLALGRRLSRRENIVHICADSCELGLADGSVDVVICDRVIEHVSEPLRLLDEIYRVLRYDGFCHFEASSKHAVIERNYFLPFLSWLPRLLSELYLKLSGRKGGYNLAFPSLSQLNRLTGNFWRHDYTWMIRKNPEAFEADDTIKAGGVGTRLTLAMFKQFYPFLPTWVWVLTKRK